MTTAIADDGGCHRRFREESRSERNDVIIEIIYDVIIEIICTHTQNH